MGTTLRDELASLRIERPDPLAYERTGEKRPPGRRGGGGLRLLSWSLWLIPLGILAGAGMLAYRRYDELRSRPAVTLGLVQRMTVGEAEKLLSAKGYLKSRYQAMIGTKLAGRLERMYVEEGMKVKKGDTLAIIEHNDLKAMLASREAQLLRTQAELEEARADLWEKERENRRASRLLVQRNVAPEDAEKAQAGEKKAVARVAALEAGVKLMRANAKEIQATIATMFLYAPFDGTVVEKQGEEGEVINPMAMSSSLGRAAAVTIANLDKMDVETDVAENLMSRVKLGQPAEVSVSAVPSRRYRGRLRQVIPMGDRSRGTVKVKVEILDPDDKLFPELAATVHFLPDKTANRREVSQSYVFMPKSAVFQENGHDHVWVVGNADVIHKRRVEVATTTDALARVESGLDPGESVVINPSRGLRENETVRRAD
ncbi:MAG: efflux RND transporter periplasmic adaptor subunit [Isosphaeraceae bacterium]